MERAHTPSTTLKKGRPKSFLSWIFHNNSVPTTDETDETQESDKNKVKIYANNHLEIRDRNQHQMMNTSFSSPTSSGSYMNSTEATASNYGNHSDIEIPNRRQSHLYTPFHDNVPDNNMDHYKRRSCYSAHLAPSDANISSSSLTRSATWQPSTTTMEHQLLDADIIPDRRTSRNYAANPEIQARLNAMLNSDRTTYLTTVLQQNNNRSSGTSNIQRRSTTPSNTTS